MKGLLSVDDLKLLKRAFSYIKPYKWRFVLAFVCISFGIVVNILAPLYIGKIIANIFQKKVNLLIHNLIFLLAIFLFQNIAAFCQSYLLSFLIQNIMYDLKNDIFRIVLNMPIKAFDELRTGEFISRMHEDVAIVANSITNDFLNSIVDVIRILAIGIVVFSISLPLASVIIISFPITYLIFFISGRIARRKEDEIKVLNDDYFSKINESISGIREVKSMNIKEFCMEGFVGISGGLKSKLIEIFVLQTTAQTFASTINVIVQIVILALGGYFVINNVLAVESLIAFNSYTSQFSGSLSKITELNMKVQRILVSLERIFKLMDNLCYQKESYGYLTIENIDGNIEFKNVFFSYLQDNDVLKDFNLKIKSNGKTAIVGNSGSGKTTILNLLLRFYEPIEGEIYIDNKNIKELSEGTLRKHISIVRQEPFLFNMSIMENLLLSNSNISVDEVINACRRVYIHDFIISLPQGYDTKIGENGANLSGGQKQRIAIARAILQDSKIILFDEATSALDNESQHYIKEAMDNISRDHTVIIIAHRLSTIIDSDEIIVLNNGEVSGQGTHSALIQNNDTYRRLYERELNLIASKA